MSEPRKLPNHGPRRFGWYVGAWSLLGLAAAAYLGALSLRPDFANGILTRNLSAPESNESRTAAAEADKADAAVQGELARMRSAVGQREAQLKAMQMRVAGLQKELEDIKSGGAGAPQTANAGPSAATAPDRPEAKMPMVEIVNATPVPLTNPSAGPAAAAPALVADVPLPARRPDLPDLRQTVGALESSGIETGSLSAPATAEAVKAAAAAKAKAVATPAQPPAAPIAFGPATITRDPATDAAQVGVRLSSGPSVDALRLSWSLMSERYSAELGALEPRYISGGNAASPFALIAGPVADKAQAKSLCASLQQKGIPCSIDDYKGNAL
jgi:hypothetical protein